LNIYKTKLKIKRDFIVLIEYFEKADICEEQKAYNFYNLGCLFECGVPCYKKDIRLSIKYFEKSYEYGNLSSLVKVKIFFLNMSDLCIK
jgi:TPR repeat protein